VCVRVCVCVFVHAAAVRAPLQSNKTPVNLAVLSRNCESRCPGTVNFTALSRNCKGNRGPDLRVGQICTRTPYLTILRFHWPLLKIHWPLLRCYWPRPFFYSHPKEICQSVPYAVNSQAICSLHSTQSSNLFPTQYTVKQSVAYAVHSQAICCLCIHSQAICSLRSTQSSNLFPTQYTVKQSVPYTVHSQAICCLHSTQSSNLFPTQ